MTKKTRVVITGMGIVAPNGHGLKEYEHALREGISGVRFQEKMRDLNFGCQVAGVPQGIEEKKREYFTEETLMAMNSNMIYCGMAGMDCMRDAGLKIPAHDENMVDWDMGAIAGTGIGGMDTTGEILIPKTDEGKVKRMGSTIVERIMSSATSARLSGLLALGGQVTTNSSACTTGTEAVANAYFQVKEGRAKRMVAGGSEGSSHYIWAGFDSMRVLCRTFNDTPEKASRPMSASAGGFIPSSGAGFLMVESLDSAKARNARIYAELLGAHVNCGGHRNGGSMTAPNPEGVKRCVRNAMLEAEITPADIDLINGHLTATMADPLEIKNWIEALELRTENFPWINSTKSLIGHGLGAAGGMECVAVVLQLAKGFIHGSINCEDLHPGVQAIASRIPHKTINTDIKVIAKSSFGFGDVNGCLIFQKWEE